MQIDYDSLSDVLYIKRTNAVIADNEPCVDDTEIVRSFDRDGTIIGVIFIGADKTTPLQWSRHPERLSLPNDIVEALDSWILQGVKTG
jgi:uncharacterized protein YuzE